MKKLTKILTPALSCCALTTTIPLGITSCSPTDTKIVGYTVDKNTYMMYGLNASGERIKLSKEQLEEMKQGYLVALGDGSYKYINRQGKDEQGTFYANSIELWMERAAEQHAYYYEIWLLGGNYNLESIDQAKKSHINFDIKGIADYEGKRTSSIYIVPGHPNPDKREKVTGKINLGNFRNLTFTAVNITGALDEMWGNDWSVIGAEAMSFQYCHFQGLAIFETEYLDLYRCSLTSASDIIKWREPDYSPENPTGRKFSTTQYALWVKNVNFVSVSYCSFVSNGKALKIETKAKDYNPTFVFNTCDFIIDKKKGIPNEIYEGDEKTESDQDKFAVEVDNKSLWNTSYKLYIYWYKFVGDIITPEDPGRDHTYKQHYGKIGSIDTTQWNSTYAKIYEGHLPQ